MNEALPRVSCFPRITKAKLLNVDTLNLGLTEGATNLTEANSAEKSKKQTVKYFTG